MLAGVTAVAPNGFVVVLPGLERRLHLEVGEIPVAGGGVEIVGGVLEEYADVLLVGLADDARIAVAAANVGEAADVAEDLAEHVGPLPGGGEGADAPGGGAANAAGRGVGAQLVLLADLGQYLLFEKLDILRRQRIVFKAAIAKRLLRFVEFVREHPGAAANAGH